MVDEIAGNEEYGVEEGFTWHGIWKTQGKGSKLSSSRHLRQRQRPQEAKKKVVTATAA